MEITNVVREPNIRRTEHYLKGAERATDPGERQTRDGEEVLAEEAAEEHDPWRILASGVLGSDPLTVNSEGRSLAERFILLCLPFCHPVPCLCPWSRLFAVP